MDPRKRLYICKYEYLRQVQHLEADGEHLKLLQKHLKTIITTDDLGWSIIGSSKDMAELSSDKVYQHITAALPEIKQEKLPHPILEINIHTLHHYINHDSDQLEENQEMIEAKQKIIDNLLYSSSFPPSLQFKIGSFTTVVLDTSAWNTKLQTQVKNCICLLLTILSLLDRAGLKIKSTEKLKDFGIDIQTSSHFQNIEAEHLTYIDVIKKPEHDQFLRLMGIKTIYIDPFAKRKSKKGNDFYAPYQQLEKSLPDANNKNISLYLSHLRKGNIFGLLDIEKYILDLPHLESNESNINKIKRMMSPLRIMLTKEEINFIMEMLKLDFNKNDLKQLFHFQLLMQDLERIFDSAASLQISTLSIKQLLRLMEFAFIIKEKNFTGISFEEIDALKKNYGKPSAEDEDQYKTQALYQEFLKNYELITLENLSNKIILSELDKQKLNKMITEKRGNFLSRFSSSFNLRRSGLVDNSNKTNEEKGEKEKGKEKEKEKEENNGFFSIFLSKKEGISASNTSLATTIKSALRPKYVPLDISKKTGEKEENGNGKEHDKEQEKRKGSEDETLTDDTTFSDDTVLSDDEEWIQIERSEIDKDLLIRKLEAIKGIIQTSDKQSGEMKKINQLINMTCGEQAIKKGKKITEKECNEALGVIINLLQNKTTPTNGLSFHIRKRTPQIADLHKMILDTAKAPLQYYDASLDLVS